MSIPLASKASGQVTVVDVTDAYSVLLTSESYTFVGNTTGAPSGLSCATQVVAYCGTQQCSKISISTVTCPTGISATISNNNTSSPTVTFKTTATITQACEATIPVVVDGVTINKKFSFAVAKQGGTGLDGKGIKSTTITYQIASSGATAPTGTWSETIPSTDPSNPYLWTRTVVTYTDNTTSTSYSVSSTLEGVSVGSRNYVRDGDFSNGMTYWDKNGLPETIETVSVNHKQWMHIVCSGGKNFDGFNQLVIPFHVNTLYTLSFTAYSPTDGTAVRFIIHQRGDGDIEPQISSQYALTTTPTRYNYSFTSANNSAKDNFLLIVCGDPGSNVEFYVTDVKLELGNIATDWTPAPEDQESDVTSKIEQLKDSISLSVTDGAVGKTAKIKLGIDDETKEASIDLTGAVTFSDLSTSGKTTINGSNITTGTLSAERINVDELMAKHLTSTGGLSVTGNFELQNGWGSISKYSDSEYDGWLQISASGTTGLGQQDGLIRLRQGYVYIDTAGQGAIGSAGVKLGGGSVRINANKVVNIGAPTVEIGNTTSDSIIGSVTIHEPVKIYKNSSSIVSLSDYILSVVDGTWEEGY